MTVFAHGEGQNGCFPGSFENRTAPVCQGLEMTHVVHFLVEDANDQYSTVPLQEIEHHMASDMKYS